MWSQQKALSFFAKKNSLHKRHNSVVWLKLIFANNSGLYSLTNFTSLFTMAAIPNTHTCTHTYLHVIEQQQQVQRSRDFLKMMSLECNKKHLFFNSFNFKRIFFVTLVYFNIHTHTCYQASGICFYGTSASCADKHCTPNYWQPSTLQS